MRKTKIVATLGPATDVVLPHAPVGGDILRELMVAGMDVARMNMSHQDAATHRRRAARVRELERELEHPTAILVDTKGPEIRLGMLERPVVELVTGQPFTLLARPVLGNEKRASVDFAAFTEALTPGDKVLIDDGKLELQVTELRGEEALCTVKRGGALFGKKGIHVPGARFSLPFVSDADRADLQLACEIGADYVAASFTRTAADVALIRRELAAHGGERIRVIAKIESAEGVAHLDEILRVADGVMIARGDMGVEFPMEELPAIQKEIIRKSYSAGVSVITATQMLDSMIRETRPTRAEVCDVAGAIYDGTSALMLSGETAAGQYPVDAVAMMARIAAATEEHIDYPANFRARANASAESATEAIAAAAVEAAHRLDAAAIVTVSHTGMAARMLAKYRPACPVVCVTPDTTVFRQAALMWGVVPLLLPDLPAADPLTAALRTAEKAGRIPQGRQVVAVSGDPFHTLRIVKG